MSDVEPKPQQRLDETADADPLAATWVRYVAAAAMTAVATVVAIGVDSHVNIPNLSLVFVVPVVAAGVVLGLGPSLCAAVLGALAFNFFLTEPRYSLAIDDPANIWAMALLFLVGLIVSGVAFTSHRRASAAAQLRRQAALLQDYSQNVVAPLTVDAIASMTSQTLAALFRVPAVVMLVGEGKAASVKRTGDMEPSEAEMEAARSSLATGTVLRGGIYPYEACRFDYWPVRTTEGQSAVIGLAFDPDERPSAPEMQVGVVAAILALVLDRQHGRRAPS